MEMTQIDEGFRELLRDYHDELSKFLLENGVEGLEKVLVPWKSLLEAAYRKGVTVGKVIAYADMAAHVSGKTGRYTIIGLNNLELEEPEPTVPQPKPKKRGRRKTKK